MIENFVSNKYVFNNETLQHLKFEGSFRIQMKKQIVIKSLAIQFARYCW